MQCQSLAEAATKYLNCLIMDYRTFARLLGDTFSNAIAESYGQMAGHGSDFSAQIPKISMVSEAGSGHGVNKWPQLIPVSNAIMVVLDFFSCTGLTSGTLNPAMCSPTP